MSILKADTILFAVLAAGVFMFCGCTLFDRVPEGRAPEGAIVSNRARQDFDERSAVNYMTTSLSVYLLTDPLAENAVAVESDAGTGVYAARVLEEISRITATVVKEKPCVNILKTQEISGHWYFKLFTGNKLVWSEHLDLSLCRNKTTHAKGTAVK